MIELIKSGYFTKEFKGYEMIISLLIGMAIGFGVSATYLYSLYLIANS